MHALAMLTLLLTAVDHWTTYLCLRAPVEGWVVTEANPIADYLFSSMGLVPGLLFDGAVTVAALTFLVTTHRFHHSVKGLVLGIIIGTTGFAVVNNLQAMRALGLSLSGAA